MSNSKHATTSKFKFKSVGNVITDEKFDRSEDKDALANVKIGIKTPVRNSEGADFFDMHNDPREQLKDNLKNLILTNQGERLINTSFGANLKSALYDFSKDREYKQTIENMIRDSAQKFMPAINITEVQSVVIDEQEKNSANRSGLAKLKLRVIFSVPVMRVDNLAVEVSMFIGG